MSNDPQGSNPRLRERTGTSNRPAARTGVPPARLLSVNEVAGLLQIPVHTIYQWRLHGRGPRSMRVGRYVRFDPDDLSRWIEERKAAS